MLRSIETTAKTEDLAIASALEQLGKSREEVSVEILERSKSGFLGIGSTPARVRVSYEYIETPAEKAEAFLKGLLERMGSDAVPEVEDRGRTACSSGSPDRSWACSSAAMGRPWTPSSI